MGIRAHAMVIIDLSIDTPDTCFDWTWTQSKWSQMINGSGMVPNLNRHLVLMSKLLMKLQSHIQNILIDTMDEISIRKPVQKSMTHSGDDRISPTTKPNTPFISMHLKMTFYRKNRMEADDFDSSSSQKCLITLNFVAQLWQVYNELFACMYAINWWRHYLIARTFLVRYVLSSSGFTANNPDKTMRD